MKKFLILTYFLFIYTIISAQIPALLADINNSGDAVSNSTTIFEFNGAGFFAANDGVNGVELWKTDGTTGGTSMIMDIFPGSNGSFPHGFGELNNQLFFGATDYPGLEKLWVSDGTALGTVPFKQICPYYNPSSNIHLMTRVGNVLIFIANDGTHGEELWITDGTDPGTTLVKDIDTIPETVHWYSQIRLQYLTTKSISLQANLFTEVKSG